MEFITALFLINVLFSSEHNNLTTWLGGPGFDIYAEFQFQLQNQNQSLKCFKKMVMWLKRFNLFHILSQATFWRDELCCTFHKSFLPDPISVASPVYFFPIFPRASDKMRKCVITHSKRIQNYYCESLYAMKKILDAF